MKKHRKFIVYWVIGITIVFILSFISGLQDDVYIQKYHQEVWYKDIFNYFKYFFAWILPYWWLLILGGGSILGILIFLIKSLFELIINKVR